MNKTVCKSEEFSFDDLNWSEKEISKIKEEADTLCAKHNGDIELKTGKVSYWKDGSPYYNDPSCWPRYVVSWEEDCGV